MDFNATIDLIIKDLNEAREIIDDLKKYPGVPVLQVELAKAKCRNAGEIISLLKNLKEATSQEDPGIKPVLQADKAEQTSRTDPVSQTEPESLPEAIAGGIIPEIDNDQQEELIPEQKDEDTIIRMKDSGTSIIADRFNNLSTRLNEQMGNKKGEDDIGGILKSKPLANLSEAIGINDRFLFIREIFNGNRDAYNQAINRLNHSTDMEDAKTVILGYAGNKSGNDAVKQLLDLVKRKLTRDE
jgi:hypothetical protein